jgi:hypothetical protein
VVLTGPAGSNHLWNTGDSTQAITVKESGQYQVVFNDALGNLFASGVIEVEVNPSLSVNAQVWPATNGFNTGMIQLDVSGGKGFGYTVTWNDGSIGAIRSGLAPGTYTATVSDGNCPKTLSYTLGSSVVTNGIMAAEYFVDSDPGVGNGTLLPLSQGMLAAGSTSFSTQGWAEGIHQIGVRVLDFAGTWSHAANYRVWIEPAHTPQPAGLLAELEYFFDSDPGPGSGQSISISPAALLNGSFNIPTTGLSSGTHEFALRAKDEYGNWSIIKTGLFDNCTPPPVPVVTASSIGVCAGNSVQLGCTPGSADPVLWSGPNGYSSTLEDPLIAVSTIAQTGYYTVQSVGPGNCLSAPDSVWVEIDEAPGQPGSIVGNSAICGALVTQNYFVSPVAGANSYFWQLPAGSIILSGNGSNQIAVDLNGWLGTVDSVRVYAINNCDTTASPPLLLNRFSSTVVVSAQAQGATTFCLGDSVDLDVSPSSGLFFQWRRNGVDLPGEGSSSLRVYQSGQYDVLATDPSGCSGLSNPISVTVNNCGGLMPPTVNTLALLAVGETTAQISGEVLSAGSSNILDRGVVYDTVPNPDLSKGVSSSGTGTGGFTTNLSGLSAATTYYAKAYATNAAGTSYGSELSFTTDCPKPINVSIVLTDEPFCAGDNATLRAGFTGGTGVKTILWSTGATTKYVVVPTGTYWVKVTDALGCSSSDTLTVSNPAGIAFATSLVSLQKSGANFTVTWNLFSPPAGVSVIGYRVAWRLRNSGNAFIQSPILGAAVNSYVANLSGLCYGNYEFVVFVRYRIGTGPALTSSPSCPLSRGHNSGPNPACKDQEAQETSEDEFLPGENIHLYPNPTHDLIFLSSSRGSSYSVLDMSGRVLLTGICSELETPIELGDFAQGVYLIQVEYAGRIWQERVLRQ